MKRSSLAALACLLGPPWSPAAPAGTRRCVAAPSSAVPAARPTVGGADDAPPRAIRARVVLDFARDLDACTLGHRGVLLDFGDASMRAALHPGFIALGDDEVVEHEGATWLRARARVLTVELLLARRRRRRPRRQRRTSRRRVRGLLGARRGRLDRRQDGRDVVRSARARRASSPRARARRSRSRPAGTSCRCTSSAARARPTRRSPRSTGSTSAPATPASPTPRRPAATPRSTRRSAAARCASVSLRAPGFVRCSGWIPANATLEASLATAGGGDADVEARLVRDRRRADGARHGARRGRRGATGRRGRSRSRASTATARSRRSRSPCCARRPATRVLLGEPSVVAAGSAAGRRAARRAQRGARRPREHLGEVARAVGRPARGARARRASRPRAPRSPRTAPRARSPTPWSRRC